MTFVHPNLLWLLLIVPIILIYHFTKYGKENSLVKVPSLSSLKHGYKGWRSYIVSMPIIFRVLSLGFLIVALARPQSSFSFSKDAVKGIDIMLTIDVSSSMKAMDLKPDRITEARKVAESFIDSRKNDNIGIVEFASQAYTICPLTTDHITLLSRLSEVTPGELQDGTAIGDALATAISRLNDSKSKSKVVILLTDGSNNAGKISPSDAAKLAIPFGIRVYTIAVGTNSSTCPYPYDDGMVRQIINIPVDVDEDPLKEIANLTGGEFFRATDNKSLEEIYKQIDKLEKTKLTSRKYSFRNENFQIFLAISLLFLLLDFITRNIILRKNP